MCETQREKHVYFDVRTFIPFNHLKSNITNAKVARLRRKKSTERDRETASERNRQRSRS